MDSSSPCELGAFDRADLRMWQYYRTVPALYRYRVFGIEFSNKTFPWIFAAQVSSPSAHLKLTSALLLQATRLDTRLACRPTDGLLLPHGHALLPSLTAAAAAALASASRMANSAGPVPTAGARLLAHRRELENRGLRGLLAARAGLDVPAPRPAETEGDETPTPPTARGAMGEWVDEMTGRSTRAPTEQEIAALSNMFPNLSRPAIIDALQRR
ncbi:hypothetical protein A1Q2_01582 [Trichosporon asahii var. asahii CBS 8904]|uniref:CUE domain-containing protein n=2 Tax=Trichosporon asahii var. asahii TaxID=189963 RepID=K1VX90_TRIAC|nr:hypothetical protein A1Q1_05124 [Trichosporon asahii var. asahii CBS 2479]EJT46295.1 hypothetical protein A1Q1_05124 [Trichosporon asahii var. asahii CBS 2479]EKD04107.1 hypothetical protein A1Q2_01582 [Trichosporon asahii var. asahii CBS 8904]